ncbi:MAG TPA: hypothetical protein PL000_19405 [Anaerolineales bacterium]|nr:hypothetical protein [Anaerolineales bacterium]
MTWEWDKERDEAADEYVGKPADDAYLASQRGFKDGADWGRAYELKRAAELVEKLKAIIWAYENNVG